MLPAIAGGLAAGAGTVLMGKLLQPEYKDEGAALNRQIYGQVQNIALPTEEELKYQLQQMVYSGDLSPEEASYYEQNPSEFAKIAVSDGRSAQLKALEQLQDISTSGGMTVSDKATLEEIQKANAAKERGSREAIIQNAMERGVGGSGVEMMAQLLNSQEAAGRANTAGLDVAKTAQQRVLDAITQSGSLGGQIQSQQFGEEAQKAAAADAIARFNTQNRQDLENTAVQNRNAAMERNLNARQAISNANTNIANEQAAQNAKVKQQVFQNALTKATGGQGAANALSDSSAKKYAADTGYTGQLIGTAGNIFSAANSSKKKNTDGTYS